MKPCQVDACDRSGICTAGVLARYDKKSKPFPRGNTRPAATGGAFDNVTHSMTTTSKGATEGAALLTVREVAMLLRLSVTSVYRLVERRALRFLRFPNGLRFQRADLDAYLASRAVEPVSRVSL